MPRDDTVAAKASERAVRAAVVQAASVAFDREATIEKARGLTRSAAELGAELVVFPEAFVSAYPRGMSFGAVVVSRSPEGREWFRRYWESSVDVPGPAVTALGGVARDHAVHLVIGVVERDGGTLYGSVLFFAPDGRCMGKHRKLMPTASERLIWGFGDGSTRRALGINPGTNVEFALDADGARLVVDPDRVADEVAGMRGAGDVELSTDEILALTRG